MAKFNGKYKYEKGENFDNFLKELGMFPFVSHFIYIYI